MTDRSYCEACGYVESHDPNCHSAAHIDGKWCADLHCNKCYGADRWINSRIAKLEVELAELKTFVDSAFQAHPNLDLDFDIACERIENAQRQERMFA